MAKAKVLDDKVVITSEVLTNEVIERVNILKPSVLILKDEDADKVLYEITSSEDISSITQYGAVFKDGKAISGLSISADTEEQRTNRMKTVITSILTKINAIEEQVKTYLEDAEDIEADIEFLD